MMGGGACLQFVQSTCTVLARIVLYFLCNAGGEIGSIVIREKDGALAGRPKGSLSNRERCDAAAGDFRSLPRFAVRLPCYGTHDVEAHPLIRFEQQVAHASFPERRQWGRRRDRELNLKQTMALCSARREAATAGQSGGQATASPGPMAHRA